MAVNDVFNRSGALPGQLINRSAGHRSAPRFSVESDSQKTGSTFPKDAVTLNLNPNLGIEIRPGPTPGHNIIKITNLTTGVVTEIPPVSEADLSAYVASLLKS